MAPRWLLIAAAGLCACSAAPDPPVVSGSDGSLIEDATAPVPIAAVDAGADADVDAASDAAAIPVGGAVFGDDFEDGDLEDDWDVTNVCIGCSAEIDQGAFLAKTKSIVSQETAFAHLRTTVMGAPSRVRLSFDASFPSVTLTKGSLAIATVDVSASHFFSLYLRDTDMDDMDAPAASLDEQGGPSPKRHLLTGLPPATTKARVVIDIDLGAGTANVSWGGNVVLANEPIGKSIAEDPTVRVGLIYVYGPQDPFEARFDDVLLEYY
jgi:hypothetical protein